MFVRQPYRFAAAALGLLFAAPPAHAGAWTLKQGNWQVISATIVSSANKSFDAQSRPANRVIFRKTFLSAYIEYGVTDKLTIVANPEYADATWLTAGRAPERAKAFAFSGGARDRIFDSWGVLSVQALARSAGAFELDTSYDGKPGEEFEIRVLYGTHFEMFGRDGCIDVEAAQRWTTGGRPNETPVDLTLIYDIGWKVQAYLQSFNVISEGAARPPFGHFRYHKLAFSVVRPVWGRTSLQLGGFISPAGQNALVEKGIFLSIWTKF